ncbi:hypothetical protein T4D_9187 [Trichinella pseudospiralis]|uniref:Uncharacterized protein n=1 Tax=Trichinella pseudospiralis TaxID=6337 RepID=A0A0V1FAB4_TRIPS|nr:hypothetical protein T4D_9187 [Trichinella pseudospiralis]
MVQKTKKYRRSAFFVDRSLHWRTFSGQPTGQVCPGSQSRPLQAFTVVRRRRCHLTTICSVPFLTPKKSPPPFPLSITFRQNNGQQAVVDWSGLPNAASVVKTGQQQQTAIVSSSSLVTRKHLLLLVEQTKHADITDEYVCLNAESRTTKNRPRTKLPKSAGSALRGRRHD